MRDCSINGGEIIAADAFAFDKAELLDGCAPTRYRRWYLTSSKLTYGLLRQSYTAIRALTNNELDRAAAVPFYSDAVVICQFVLEDHAVRHRYHHLARLREALK